MATAMWVPFDQAPEGVGFRSLELREDRGKWAEVTSWRWLEERVSKRLPGAGNGGSTLEAVLSDSAGCKLLCFEQLKDTLRRIKNFKIFF